MASTVVTCSPRQLNTLLIIGDSIVNSQSHCTVADNFTIQLLRPDCISNLGEKGLGTRLD